MSSGVRTRPWMQARSFWERYSIADNSSSEDESAPEVDSSLEGSETPVAAPSARNTHTPGNVSYDALPNIYIVSHKFK